MLEPLLIPLLILLSAASTTQNAQIIIQPKACGNVFTSKQVVLKSENFPRNYSNNLDCVYLIKGPNCPLEFTFEFLNFDIESSLGCTKDRLEIQDLDALCGKKQGKKSYHSQNGSLKLRFRTDSETAGKGYEIVINRSDCLESPVLDQEPCSTNSEPNCCQNEYRQKQFYLISPNFPNSMNYPSNCKYTIYKANENVCRLRIQVEFFWLGQEYQNCPFGYIKIDGKFICGCKSSLKLTSSFKQNEKTKTITFLSTGIGVTGYSGFVLEVIQDACPKRLEPDPNQKESNYDNDQINRLAWPNHTQRSLVERLDLINEKTEVLQDSSSRTVKYVYVFGEGDNDLGKEVEETDFVDTSSIGSVLVDRRGIEACLIWNQDSFYQISAKFRGYFPKCTQSSKFGEEDTPRRSCVELPYVQGYFRSPGYPLFYPDNIAVCYRFIKQPGYCGVKIIMNDFQLEYDPQCSTAFMQWGEYKYCGASLHNTASTIDLRSNSYVEADFRTLGRRNPFYCGRGFSGVYEQIACQEKPWPSPTTPPASPCGGLYSSQHFVLEADQLHTSCKFTIHKSSPDVCRVKLTFQHFDISCQKGSLLIEGTSYCGKHRLKEITLDLTEGDQEIVYNGNGDNQQGILFRIIGEQGDLDCYPEVPAQITKKADFEQKTDSSDNFKKFLFAAVDKNFKDICGIISSTKEVDLPESFCNLLMINNATKCTPLKSNILYVPYKSKNKTLELKVQETNRIEEIEFEEIDCDNLISN